jgi:outer membrane immunogenic protein
VRIKFASLLTVALSLGVAQAASAADLLVKAPIYKAPAAAPAYNWSGCYVGAQAGYAWGRDKLDETVTATGATSIFSPTDTARPSGAKLGGMLGCNWQWAGPLVVGLEGDAEWADIGRSSVDYPNTGTPADTYEARIRFQSSIRGRLGYAFDRTLLYVTGGAAFANIRHRYTTVGLPAEDFSNTRTGWTLGGGAEYAFAPNWSARLEYRYADFGTTTNVPVVVWTGFTEKHRTTENAVRIGVAYKFF